jgi:hypothetical protein
MAVGSSGAAEQTGFGQTLVVEGLIRVAGGKPTMSGIEQVADDPCITAESDDRPPQ